MDRRLQVASITGRMPDCFFVATRVLRLDRWIPRKADDPRPTVTVAARAANIVEGNADRRVGQVFDNGRCLNVDLKRTWKIAMTGMRLLGQTFAISE